MNQGPLETISTSLPPTEPIWYLFETFCSLWIIEKTQSRQRCLQTVWPDLAIYWTLGNFLKPLATIHLPKSPTVLGNFCEGVKNLSYFYWNHFCATFIDIWWFFSGHTACNGKFGSNYQSRGLRFTIGQSDKQNFRHKITLCWFGALWLAGKYWISNQNAKDPR